MLRLTLKEPQAAVNSLRHGNRQAALDELGLGPQVVYIKRMMM